MRRQGEAVRRTGNVDVDEYKRGLTRTWASMLRCTQTHTHILAPCAGGCSFSEGGEGDVLRAAVCVATLCVPQQQEGAAGGEKGCRAKAG